MNGNAKVQVFGEVATFVVRRYTDGHTLSLSSLDQTLVHFNGNTAVHSYGPVTDPVTLLSALTDFLTEEDGE